MRVGLSQGVPDLIDPTLTNWLESVPWTRLLPGLKKSIGYSWPRFVKARSFLISPALPFCSFEAVFL